jgi:hypothetical protein
MSERAFHDENQARIENRITEVKVRLWELQERLETLEDASLDPQHTHELIEVLIEHLALMEMRLEQTRDAIREGQIIGKTGARNER